MQAGRERQGRREKGAGAGMQGAGRWGRDAGSSVWQGRREKAP